MFCRLLVIVGGFLLSGAVSALAKERPTYGGSGFSITNDPITISGPEKARVAFAMHMPGRIESDLVTCFKAEAAHSAVLTKQEARAGPPCRSETSERRPS